MVAEVILKDKIAGEKRSFKLNKLISIKILVFMFVLVLMGAISAIKVY